MKKVIIGEEMYDYSDTSVISTSIGKGETVFLSYTHWKAVYRLHALLYEKSDGRYKGKIKMTWVMLTNGFFAHIPNYKPSDRRHIATVYGYTTETRVIDNRCIACTIEKSNEWKVKQ